MTAPVPPQAPGGGIDWTGLASAGAQLGGSYLAFHGQQQTNAANAQQAREQMAFQERMSATAYQRATADMRAAGLNPMLAYQQGGASSPGGAMATMESPMGKAAPMAADAVSNAADVAQKVSSIRATNAQADKTKADEQDVRTRNAYFQETVPYLLAIQIVNRQMADLDLKYSQDTYDKRVQQVAATLKSTQASARANNAASAITEADLTRAENEQAFEKSTWGKMSHYLASATDARDLVTGVIPGAGQLGKFMKGLSVPDAKKIDVRSVIPKTVSPRVVHNWSEKQGGGRSISKPFRP